MWMMVPFILNSLLNFVVSLLVAKFLGPAEYGRFVLAVSTGIVLQTLLFDWLRLAATRFYSERDRQERPQIRATLDAAFGALALLAALAAFATYALKLDLALTPDLATLAIGVGVSNGLFDFAGALMRARFHDRAYSALVIAKNVLAFVLTVGGAMIFQSAGVALVGMMISVAGSLLLGRAELIDPDARPSIAERGLAMKFLAYGIPIVLANFLYQTVPLINRLVTAQINGFAEVGKISLAFEIGIRIVGAVGSALDVILFQIAVRVEKTQGAAAARAQVARNMGVVAAVALPSVAGCWLVLPSFEALFVPESFQGAYAHYFTLLTPALLAFALINYGVNTAYQISHKLMPLIIAALVASTANSLCVIFLPATPDASRFAVAQSVSSCAGLATLIALLVTLEPMWPRARDIVGALVATAAMLAAGLPMRDMAPGVVTLIAQMAVGVTVFGAIAFAFDVAELRSVYAGKVLRKLRP